MFDEEQGFTINDLGRRLANIIRIGTKQGWFLEVESQLGKSFKVSG